MLNCTGYFARTQTTGAGVYTLVRTVYHCSDALDVGLPGSVGTPVRVGYFDAESDVFAANFTFCHLSAPPLQGSFFITTFVFYQIFAQIASVFLKFLLRWRNFLPFLPVLRQCGLVFFCVI